MSISRQIALTDVAPVADFVTYIANNWYTPSGVMALTAGSIPGSGSIRLFPGIIKQQITINALGVKVSTLSNGGNVQAAIYANNSATMRPTGNPLVSSASMSTTTAVAVNAAVSLQLGPGLYWFASNSDNATSICTALAGSALNITSILGTSTQGNLLGNSAALGGLSVSQTFGTWPDLTSGSFSDVSGTSSIPIVVFKVASVP
jgi:hypothetical protein